MPTVTVNGKKKVFPYNAVGKAQADAFAKLHGGKERQPGLLQREKDVVTMGELKKWREQKWVRIGTDGSILWCVWNEQE